MRDFEEVKERDKNVKKKKEAEDKSKAESSDGVNVQYVWTLYCEWCVHAWRSESFMSISRAEVAA